jgi:membrane protease YdiL (CAAX protease family)
LRWVLLTLALIVVIDGITWLTGHDIVPQIMREVYASTTWPILIWLTLIVAAPLGEELLFRGLMFQGLVETWLGFIGAAIVSSLAWSLLHIQYDLRGMITVFTIGLLLAAARHFTRSTVICICMHAVMNFVATLEIVLVAP